MKLNFLMGKFLVLLLAILLLPNLSFAVQPELTRSLADEEIKATSGNEAFVYSPQGRRDPFEPLLHKEPVIAEIIKKTRPDEIKGPLEKFELKQFRLMAILVVNGSPRAMVAAPDGKSYTVKVNDYIGLNGGVVKNIQTKIIGHDETGMRVEKSPDRIVVEETGVDSLTGKEIKENRYIVM